MILDLFQFCIYNKSMVKQIKTTAFLVSTVIFLFFACSNHKDNATNSPPTNLKGKISLFNNSGVSIRFLGYTQIRGTTQLNVPVGSHLFPNQTTFLHDMIDGDQGVIFPGGDRVIVNYVADVPNPDNPHEPLFQNTVDLTVNGTLMIQVKNGGEYGIGPG
jgi:hypothetical protein